MMTSPFEWFGFENPSSLDVSMLQVLLGHNAGRLRCCHCYSKASQYSQRFRKWRHLWPKGKRNANIFRF